MKRVDRFPKVAILSGWMSGLFATVFLLGWLSGCGGGNDATDYLPPDLSSRGGQLTIGEIPNGPQGSVEGAFPGADTYLGYLFDAQAGQQYDIVLTRTSGADVPAIALYQFSDQGYGEAIAWASADAATIGIGGWVAKTAGHYLVLVDVVAGDRTGTFRLDVVCTAGCDEIPGCRSDLDCERGRTCIEGQCVTEDVDPVRQAGEMCDPANPCVAGLECLFFDEVHGYCAASCDCGGGNGCPPSAECLWGDGQSCFCGYPCRTKSDCPNGGVGWTCFDMGAETGQGSFLACIPLEESPPECTSDADCITRGLICVSGQCVPDESDPGLQAGELCDPTVSCAEGLECLLVDETHGYCAANCSGEDGSGCPPPSECLWDDGRSYWCGYTCRIKSDCPNGGVGWTCFDIGAEMGQESFLACIPMEENPPECTSDADCGARGLICVGGQCVPDESDPGLQAGELCDPTVSCAAGLECRLFDETHGYCAASCSCENRDGCPPPSECLWGDERSCWCGYTCRTTSDCPNGGVGWSCFDIGAAAGEESFLVCVPLEESDVDCASDPNCSR